MQVHFIHYRTWVIIIRPFLVLSRLLSVPAVLPVCSSPWASCYWRRVCFMALEHQRNLLQNEHGANKSCHLTQKDGSTLPSKIKLPQKCLKCSIFIMTPPQQFFTDFIFLCRLYRSLGDYDVVRGIFSGKIGTKSVTFTALQAEAKSDYAEAVKLYNEVLMCAFLVTNKIWEHKRVPCFPSSPLKWFCAAAATLSVSVYLFPFYMTGGNQCNTG